MKPPVMFLHAAGTNRDREAAWACELAGGAPEIVPITALTSGQRSIMEAKMLVLPGGFSNGDDLGAGRVWALALRQTLGDQIEAFVAAGRPILGICNGFQALIKAGLLGDEGVWETQRKLTLTHNASARFECRWVWLEPEPESPCIFTRGMTEPIFCPIAHGEGRVMARDEAAIAAVEARKGAALRYISPDGEAVDYPANPNGSVNNIAGVCNAAGTVMGLMPHPEDHIVPRQHPRRHRGESGNLGLVLFRNGVRYAAEL